jgi:hypothetical protein
MSESLENLENLDLVWGAKAIAAELNCNQRQAFWLLETKKNPAKKCGRLWVASRKQLRQFFAATEAA